ncbi:MAG TPA: hypothetical protein EYO18_03325 [Candidatus Marinimicrobia bacterium]|nr:hypothetical protein [Candidatus Neomarinimicrobiota bacterium]
MSKAKLTPELCFVFLLSLVLTSLGFTQVVPENVINRIHFRSIGPTKQTGRFMQVGVPDLKKLPYTFYAASSTGGLWKTTDNGVTYIPVFDNEETLVLSDVEVAFSDPDIIYVGTGNLSYWGNGIYRSTNGGESWIHAGLKDSYFISKIVIHPENPDVVYAAVPGNIYIDSPQRGIFMTRDGGKTWEKILGIIDNGKHVSGADVHMHPTDFNTLYASLWDPNRGEASGIYKSVNGGSSWDKLSGGLPTGKLQRIGLDIYRSNPDVVVAAILIENSGHTRHSVDNTIWRTKDAGKSWQRISPDLENFPMRGGNRYAQIRIDPNDENKIYVLNSGIQGTHDGGKTWKGAIIPFGNDHQDLWFNPLNSDHLIGSSDSGIRISFNGSETWYHPDNLPCGQFFTVAVDMDFPYNVYGGLQDFGTWKGPNTKRGRFPIRFEDWEHVKGADGGDVQVDPADSRWLYVQSQYGDLTINDQKTSVRKNITYQKEGIRFNYIAPVLVSPHNSNVIYHGANMLLRSDFRGESWREISPDLTNQRTCADNEKVWGTITSIDESPVKQGVIWVGTDDGNVQLTQDGGKTWTKLNDRIPKHPEGLQVTRVISSHHNPGTAYVSFLGTRSNFDASGHAYYCSPEIQTHLDLKPYCYKTTDFGKSWTSITGNLPNDEPINVIQEDHKNPNLLFVGTSRCIYVSIDNGANWTSMKNNMPYVPIHDLCIHPRENDLVVGSFGRSFWIADISPLQELNPSVLAKDIHLFEVEPQVLWILSGQKQVAADHQNYSGENAPKGIVVNYYLKNEVKNGVTVQVYQGAHLINEYKGSGEPGLNSVEWYLTKRIPRTEEEKKQAARWIERTNTEELYFDYYDGHDHFEDPDEEVSVTGRSLGIWIQAHPEWREVDYKHVRAKPGEYRIKLLVNGKEFIKNAVILKDHWYDKGY